MRRDPIDFPPHDTMHILIGLMTGHDLQIVGGRLAIRFNDFSRETVAVDDDALTELERRGWIVIHEDEGGITVTESGCYWARRWTKSHRDDVRAVCT